jgi:hypothetical protein
MFGFFKRNKAPERVEFVPAEPGVRLMVIRSMLKRRVEDDPVAWMLTDALGKPVDEVTDMEVLATQEAFLLALVERYIACGLHGMTSEQTFQLIHSRYESSLRLDGVAIGSCPPQINLVGYAEFIMRALQTSGKAICPISADHIKFCLGAGLNLYPHYLPSR